MRGWPANGPPPPRPWRPPGAGCCWPAGDGAGVDFGQRCDRHVGQDVGAEREAEGVAAHCAYPHHMIPVFFDYIHLGVTDKNVGVTVCRKINSMKSFGIDSTNKKTSNV